MRILIVEDEYVIAEALRHLVVAAGGEVVGTAPNVERALDLLHRCGRIDVAVLDVNLGDHPVFAVADALDARGTPFVLTTGYDTQSLPPHLRERPQCRKPIEPDALMQALLALSGRGTKG